VRRLEQQRTLGAQVYGPPFEGLAETPHPDALSQGAIQGPPVFEDGREVPIRRSSASRLESRARRSSRRSTSRPKLGADGSYLPIRDREVPRVEVCVHPDAQDHVV
jgi:hypothetical protein